MIVEESGMRFGPFEPGTTYLLESCPAYLANMKGNKIAEFMTIQKNFCLVVEAKTTAPNPA